MIVPSLKMISMTHNKIANDVLREVVHRIFTQAFVR